MGCSRWPSAVGIAVLAAAVAGSCSTGLTRGQSAAHDGGAGFAWVSPIGRDHPLVGATFDVARGRTVTPRELAAALAAADVVLLGEQHDNADHHRLQAGVVEDLVASQRLPAVAFEQLDLERQAAIDRVLTQRSRGDGLPTHERATAVSDAVAWDKSGWPPFESYRPVFEAALAANLPVRAANLSRERLREFPPGADAGAGPDLVPLPAQQRESMAAEISESHCGYADSQMVAAMVEAQRRRDAAMAAAVVSAFDVSSRLVARSARPGLALIGPHWTSTAGPRAGVVLIAGFAHARSDRGVPLYLRHLMPGLRVVSVAFVEVAPDSTSPRDYAPLLHAERLPFDFVTFTPRADDADPCEKFRAGLERMRKK